MATAIVAARRHPLQTLSTDSDLALVLELEDPLLMTEDYRPIWGGEGRDFG